MNDFNKNIIEFEQAYESCPTGTSYSSPGTTISFAEGYDIGWQLPIDEVPLYITKNIAICQGKPIIIGTRVSVVNIIELRDGLGWNIEEITSAYPFLSKEQINAAFEYYEVNKNEIDDYLKQERLEDVGS